MKPLNLRLLSRVLSQPWAIRKETLVTFTQAILAGESTAGNFPPVGGKSRSAVVATNFNTAVLKSAAGEDTDSPQPQAGYIPLNGESDCAACYGTLPPVPDGLTVLLVWGIVGRGWTQWDRWCLDAIDVDDLTAAIAAVPPGGTVVLWFRSPGGIVTGIPEAAAEFRQLAQTRRLLAFTDDLCASAAYWLAAQCASIVATPTAEVGSIGVYLAYYDFCAMLEQMGVKLELFKAGDLKAIGLLGNPLDDPARAYLKEGVDEAYAQFTADVLAMRQLDDATMQGQTLSGPKALAANLVDAFYSSASAFFAALGQGSI